MDFREEYKSAAEIITPDSEVAQRIKSGALAGVSPISKRGSALKAFSITGGAVAACAVVTVGALLILPRIGGVPMDMSADSAGGSGFTNGVSSLTTEMAHQSANDAAQEADGVFDYDEAASDYGEEAASSYSGVTSAMDKGNADSGPSAENANIADNAAEDVEEVFDDSESLFDDISMIPAETVDCAEPESYTGEVLAETRGEYDAPMSTEQCSADGQFELSSDMYICVWEGVTYILDPGAEYDDSSMLSAETVDCAGTVYDIEYSDEVLYLFGEGREFLGAFFAE